MKNHTYLYLPTYPLNSFRFFRFSLQPRFCLCNMPFLIFYPPSRGKTHVCFYSFLENLMRSQRETRYHYQNLIEHQYIVRFESIPLDSFFLDKLFSSTKTYSENVFELIEFLFDSALTTTDKAKTIAFCSSSGGSSITSGICLNHLRKSDFDGSYIEPPSVKADGKLVTSLLNTLLTCSLR